MRLFTAILPDEAEMQALRTIQDEMKKQGFYGRFTDLYNLHMTLIFIGEYDDPDEVLDLMEEIPFEHVQLKPKEIRKLNDLYALIFEEDQNLNAYVRKLKRKLEENGIPYDRKSFLPHVTLLRKASGKADRLNQERIVNSEWDAHGVSLMKSEFGRNGMIYTELGYIQEETGEIAMADTKTMAEKWNMTKKTVASLCAHGFIPAADKVNGKWEIPETVPKPPCSVRFALRYLSNIEMINEGAVPKFFLYGKKTEEIVDAYEYLKDLGFCTDFRWISEGGEIDFQKTLTGVKLTAAGREFMKKNAGNSSDEDSSSFEISVNGKAGSSKLPVEGSVNVKYSRKSKE